MMKITRYLLFFACFIPLLYFRDFTPNNELKYLSIADEALREGHWFTFWNHGALYADKPPLYLWIVMLGKWLLGTHSMFFLGLFSLIPALWILFIMDKWVNTALPSDLRLSSQFMLLTSGLFTGSAIVLRMDMLMSLFIILSLYTFYRIYTGRCSPADPIKLPIYIFLAIFTKGPVGLIIPLLTIPAFLLVKKQFKTIGKYLGWKQWSILIGLCSLWFIAVYLEGEEPSEQPAFPPDHQQGRRYLPSQRTFLVLSENDLVFTRSLDPVSRCRSPHRDTQTPLQ